MPGGSIPTVKQNYSAVTGVAEGLNNNDWSALCGTLHPTPTATDDTDATRHHAA